MTTMQVSAAGSGVAANQAADPKLTTAARQFESVLLGQWLQEAESSFGSVPGGDGDSDAGGDQMRSFGTQQLANSFTASGGVGIAKLVLGALNKVNEKEHNAPETTATHATYADSAAMSGALAAYRAEGVK